MRDCPYCGTQVVEQAAVCPSCGKELKDRERPVCPNCGDQSEADDYFCGRCGAVLIAQSAGEGVPWSVEAASPTGSQEPADEGPHLVVTNGGTIIRLPLQGEANIGREDPVTGAYPEINLEPFDAETYGVSRLHARLIIEKDQVFIEDLGSLNATFVNTRLVKPQARQQIYDGDEIQLAGFSLTFRSR